MRKDVMIAVVTASICIALAVSVNAETIILRSGNAPIGQADPQIQVWGTSIQIGDINQEAAPVSQQQAVVISAHPAWVEFNPGTNWVSVDGSGVGPSGDYIYETTFVLPQRYINPTLNLSFCCDDHGHLLFNEASYPDDHAAFGTGGMARITIDDPSLFRAGANKLDFFVYNLGGPTGLDYYAVVSYDPVPESSSILTMLCGIGGLGGLGLRKIRR